MPHTLQIGAKGEEQALAFLRGLGYDILHVNWRFRKLEIDIIARDGDFLVIVEVKTRKNADFGEPETFVTKKKQQNLIRAAHFFILENNVEQETRFDIVSVNNFSNEVVHIKSAFYPSLK